MVRPPLECIGCIRTLADARKGPRSVTALRFDVLETSGCQVGDVDGPGDENVADENERQCRLTGRCLLGQVVEVELGNLGEFLVRGQVERGEIILWWRSRDVVAGAAVQPMGAAVVYHGIPAGESFDWDAHDSSLEQSRVRETDPAPGSDEVDGIQGRQVDRVTPGDTEMGNHEVEHRFSSSPLRSLQLVDVGVFVAQTVQRVDRRSAEILGAQVVDARHLRTIGHKLRHRHVRRPQREHARSRRRTSDTTQALIRVPSKSTRPASTRMRAPKSRRALQVWALCCWLLGWSFCLGVGASC